MPKIKLSRQIILDGVLRKPSEGEIEVSEEAASRAEKARAIVKPQPTPSAVPSLTPKS